MRVVDLKEMYVNGENYKRAVMNFKRLETEEYDLVNVFKEGGYSWPGDFEGRTILGLVLLAQATHREPKYLKNIIEELPRHMNEKGYFGTIHPRDTIDEQQLSGNSWFLRAMVEYYLWKKDKKVYDIIEKVVKNLYLATRGYYKEYPLDPSSRIVGGEAIGSTYTEKVGNWILSTDVGCAFIALDGVAHAYEILKSDELKELIDEMINKFLAIDIVGLSFQTHATLSATRGLLKYYEVTNNEKLLAAVEELYKLYTDEGMTENYANYNWFNRPEWTEPCAIIDSFILSYNLWKNTGKVKYLENAHYIFFNGMGHAQRNNGGFGCDTCSGEKDEFIALKEGLYEAYWCCTMRGGEGLSRALEFGYLYDNECIVVPFYNDNTSVLHFEDEKVVIKESTEYPYEGIIKFEVVHSDVVAEKIVKLHIPSWGENVTAILNDIDMPVIIENGFIIIRTLLTSGTKIELSFETKIREERLSNKHSIKGYHRLMHGALVLGFDDIGEALELQKSSTFHYLGKGRYKVEGISKILCPINDISNKTREEAINSKKQILFKNS